MAPKEKVRLMTFHSPPSLKSNSLATHSIIFLMWQSSSRRKDKQHSVSNTNCPSGDTTGHFQSGGAASSFFFPCHLSPFRSPFFFHFHSKIPFLFSLFTFIHPLPFLSSHFPFPFPSPPSCSLSLPLSLTFGYNAQSKGNWENGNWYPWQLKGLHRLDLFFKTRLYTHCHFLALLFPGDWLNLDNNLGWMWIANQVLSPMKQFLVMKILSASSSCLRSHQRFPFSASKRCK